jgi:hypothetical protein
MCRGDRIPPKGVPSGEPTTSLKKIKKLVGVIGFEPTASSSRTKRATGLRYTPCKSDANLINYLYKFQVMRLNENQFYWI